jgi:exopolysaccharide biosynthesis polyprenyl glycosylphosphotransferase
MQPALSSSVGTPQFRRTTKPTPRWIHRAFLGAIVVIDAATANLCVWLAFLVRFEGTLPGPNWAAVQHLWLPITVALLASYSLVGLYLRNRELSRAEIGSLVVRGNLLWLFASFAIAYLRRDVAGAYPTAVFFLSAAFNAALSFGIHVAWEQIRKTHIDPAHRVRRAVLIGATPEAQKLREAASTGADFVYVFADGFDDGHGRAGEGRTQELRRFVLEEGVEEVVVADSNLPRSELLRHLVQCAGLDVRFKVVPGLLDLVRVPGQVKVVSGVPLVDLFGDEMPTMRDIGRRIFDVVAATVGLVLTLPLWPLIVLAVKISSPGHVLYRQERVGLHGRSFKLLKFRTMRADAEARTGPVLATLDDRRVTAVGRFLRRCRLDELPQLLNILVGDMSLVGPRPERPHFVGQFLKSVPQYAERYRVRPGVTGLAQVRGGYDTPARNKARYDLIYLRNRSLTLDLRILAQTVVIVLAGRGAR